MEWALLLEEFLYIMTGVVASGYFVHTVNDGSSKELAKQLVNAVEGAGQDVNAFIKYASARIAAEGTAQNEKTLAAMAAIRGEGDNKYVTGKCLLYEDGSEKGGAFAVMDKVTAFLSTASACGLQMTTAKAKELVDTIGINWSKWQLKDGRIMTIIDEEGKTEYMPNELVNDIKNRLYDAGAFSQKVDLILPEVGIPYTYKINLEDMLRHIIDKTIVNKELFYSIVDHLWTDYGLDELVIDDKTLIYVDQFALASSQARISLKIINDCELFEQINYNSMFEVDEVTGLWRRSEYSKKTWDEDFTLGGLVLNNYTTTNKRKVSSLILGYNFNSTTNKYVLLSGSVINGLYPTNSLSEKNKVFTGLYNGYFNFGELKDVVEGVDIQTGALLPTYEEQMEELLQRIGQTKGKVKYRADEDSEAVEYVPVARPIAKEDEKIGTQAQDKAIADIIADTLKEILEDTTKTTDDVITDNPPLPNPTFPPIGVINLPNLDPIGDTGFVGIYNPNRLQLRQFTGWLWSDDFLDFVAKKMFGDPFNAIISLHAIYCTPVSNGSSAIVCGRTNSHITANTVNQYVNINCGNIKINRYFNNARDYQAKIEIYLPFIGVRDLDIADVIDRTINVTYKVDVLTGTCIAMIKVDGQVLYHFEGNCACQIPISGQSYSALFGALTAGLGVAIGAATGGAALPVVAAAGAAGIAASKEPVKKSGNFGSNSGAMDIKKPYLIITRNVPYEAGGRGEFEGLPCNVTRTLNQCTGFTKIKEINLNNITATKQELEELKELMSEGIIL